MGMREGTGWGGGGVRIGIKDLQRSFITLRGSGFGCVGPVTHVLQSCLLQATKDAARAGSTPSVVFAAQCFHHDSGADAKFMLQAVVTYTSGSQQGVHTIASDASWQAFDATGIYNPLGGMGGDVPLDSSDNQPAENIDATAMAAVAGWTQGAPFTPGWTSAAPRVWLAAPQPKQTLPIQFSAGRQPIELTLLGPGHWFVDFGTVQMAGLTATISGTSWQAL